jgi:hypothetical protein
VSQEDEIPKHYQSQFTQNVAHLVQKQGSLLLPYVDASGAYMGESQEVVKQFGSTKARRGDNSRHGDTPIMSTPRDQRWVVPENIDWGDLFDRNDLMKMLIDPTSPITKAAVMAMGRETDITIINAFFGDAKTGKAGATITPFPASSQDVGIQVGTSPAADTGLNVAKIIRGRRILREKYAIQRGDPLFFVGGARQEEELFNDERFTNTRYRRTAVLEDADSNEFFRVNFLFLEEMPTDPADATHRWCALYPQSAIHFGRWNGGLETFLARNPQKKFNWQLYMKDTQGATRVEEKKVVRVICKEA